MMKINFIDLRNSLSKWAQENVKKISWTVLAIFGVIVFFNEKVWEFFGVMLFITIEYKLYLWLIIGYLVYSVYWPSRHRIAWHWKKSKSFKQPYNLSIDDGLGVLTLLFRIRAAEIGAMYATIREYQQKVGTGYWIDLFMQDFIDVPYDWWEDTGVYDKREKKLKEKASEVFSKYYEIPQSLPSIDSYRERIQDVRTALLFWNIGPDRMIHNLEAVRSFGVMQEELSELIVEYKIFGKGSFRQVFGRYSHKKVEHRCGLRKTDLLWSKILDALRAHLTLKKQQDNIDRIKVQMLFEVV